MELLSIKAGVEGEDKNLSLKTRKSHGIMEVEFVRMVENERRKQYIL